MNKVICVEAHFKSWEEKGFFGTTKQKTSDARIDFQRLQKDVQSAVDTLNRDGYEVVSITPITSGAYEANSSAYAGWGYGYSFTEAVLVTAQCK